MDVKDPAIKLFGKKIVLPENEDLPPDGEPEKVISVDDDADDEVEIVVEDQLVENQTETKPEEVLPPQSAVSGAEKEADGDPKTPSIDEKTDNDQSDATESQQKTLKKPDKILPCPRCNSMDTKFCYYNNYNVNQPRHFCKSCQRYWTAGGTMRNMPVGAGRRKSKHSVSHNRFISVATPFQGVQMEAINGAHSPTLKSNGKVITFGSDSRIMQSTSSTSNLTDKKALDATRLVSRKAGENVDNVSVGSSVTTSNSVVGNMGVHDRKMTNIHGFASQVPCFPAVVMPYPWYPMPFYPPPPYFNCPVPAGWTIIPPQTPLPNQKAQVFDPKSMTLGKHCREGETPKPSNAEEGSKKEKSSVLVPKTLRIDDPEEAMKSSIWEALGIKDVPSSREGLFKAFQPKGDEKKHSSTTSPASKANPAASSRSLSFQERV